MRLGDGGQPALDRTGLAAFCQIGDVERDRFRRRRQGRLAVQDAPGAEVPPVGGVRAARVGRLTFSFIWSRALSGPPQRSELSRGCRRSPAQEERRTLQVAVRSAARVAARRRRLRYRGRRCARHPVFGPPTPPTGGDSLSSDKGALSEPSTDGGTPSHQGMVHAALYRPRSAPCSGGTERAPRTDRPSPRTPAHSAAAAGWSMPCWRRLAVAASTGGPFSPPPTTPAALWSVGTLPAHGAVLGARRDQLLFLAVGGESS